MKPSANHMHASLLSTLLRGGARVAASVFVAGVLMMTGPIAYAAEPAPFLAFGARVAGDDARTRVVVEFDRKPDFSIHYVANPVRVVVDLPETAFGLKAESLEPRGLLDRKSVV